MGTRVPVPPADEIINGYFYDEEGNKTGTTFHNDHLRSVTALTGHDGDTLQTSQYGPFGEDYGQTGDSENFLAYTGRENDGTGLYYYRARYYDPEVGRFLTEDPLGFEAGINFYAYVSNNPINAYDPFGKRIEISGGSSTTGTFPMVLFNPFLPDEHGYGWLDSSFGNATGVIGISLPNQFWRIWEAQIFLRGSYADGRTVGEDRYSAFGHYWGASLVGQVGMTASNDALPWGANTKIRHFEFNAGAGESVGFSLDYEQLASQRDTTFNFSRDILGVESVGGGYSLKWGGGIGVMLGGSEGRSGTLASPQLGEMMYGIISGRYLMKAITALTGHKFRDPTQEVPQFNSISIGYNNIVQSIYWTPCNY